MRDEGHTVSESAWRPGQTGRQAGWRCGGARHVRTARPCGAPCSPDTPPPSTCTTSTHTRGAPHPLHTRETRRLLIELMPLIHYSSTSSTVLHGLHLIHMAVTGALHLSTWPVCLPAACLAAPSPHASIVRGWLWLGECCSVTSVVLLLCVCVLLVLSGRVVLLRDLLILQLMHCTRDGFKRHHVVVIV